MRRSHDALSAPALSQDPLTGEKHLRHRVTRDGTYKDRVVFEPPEEPTEEEEQ